MPTIPWLLVFHPDVRGSRMRRGLLDGRLARHFRALRPGCQSVSAAVSRGKPSATTGLTGHGLHSRYTNVMCACVCQVYLKLPKASKLFKTRPTFLWTTCGPWSFQLPLPFYGSTRFALMQTQCSLLSVFVRTFCSPHIARADPTLKFLTLLFSWFSLLANQMNKIEFVLSRFLSGVHGRFDWSVLSSSRQDINFSHLFCTFPFFFATFV